MRTLTALFLLSGCYKTTQVFTPQLDSRPEDVLSLELAIATANQVAGCKLIDIDFSAKPNLTFSTDQACFEQLTADGAQGETRLSTLDAPRLCVQSFWAHPQVTQWDGMLADVDNGETTGNISSNGAAILVLLHEIGHAEGIIGHSKTYGDVMFADAAGSVLHVYDDESLVRYVAALRAAGARCLP